MIAKDKKWQTQESKEKSHEKKRYCPLCSNNGDLGAFCQHHLNALRSYHWIKYYINNIEKVDKKTIHILDFAISERVSYVINDVEIVSGKLAIEQYLEENLYGRMENRKEVKCSVFMERILLEIMSLQNARGSILIIMKEEL